MIVSPRAEKIIDVLRKEGDGFIEIDEVLLYRRAGAGSPYREILYWKRSENSSAPLSPLPRSFAIVPEMTAAVTRGFGVYGNTLNNVNAVHAWRAFDRRVKMSGSFGTCNDNTNGDNRYAWAIVAFPEPRIVRGWSLQFEYAWSAFWLAIEGRMPGSANWTRLFESASTNPVNYGRFGATAIPMQCTAVRILTDYSFYPVRSCQFFDCMPLVPVTLTSNNAMATAGVEIASEPNNHNLYRCFTEQSNAYTHGTAAWYYNGGNWQSNKGFVGTKDQNRFFIRFSAPKSMSGFSVGGIVSNDYYYDDHSFRQNCYANCLLIEGRESEADFWQPLAEVDFEPAERRTRYFDFPVIRTVSQLRITVQDVTHGTSASNSAPVYLPPMQVYGIGEGFAPYSAITETNVISTGTSGSNVVIVEQNGELFAIPITQL